MKAVKNSIIRLSSNNTVIAAAKFNGSYFKQCSYSYTCFSTLTKIINTMQSQFKHARTVAQSTAAVTTTRDQTLLHYLSCWVWLVEHKGIDRVSDIFAAVN
jgi:hypothetical protein